MAPPPKNTTEIRNRERFISYQKGWEDGAAPRRRREPDFIGHAKPWIVRAYQKGYLDGEQARLTAIRAAAEAYAYDLEHSVLR